MYERLNRTEDNAVAYRITRPLSREEVKIITTELEGMIASGGNLRIMIDLETFPYADLKSLWEDLKFDLKYAKDLDRFALVGGGKIEKWGTRLFGTLSMTKCRCFEANQCDQAWAWLIED